MTTSLPSIPAAPAGDGKELTDMQAAFVENFASNGGDREQAALDAGYSPATVRQQALELLKKPHVMQAIIERSAVELISNAPAAVSRLRELMTAKSDYVSLEATKEILDRAGLKPVEKHDHRISGDIAVHIDLS